MSFPFFHNRYRISSARLKDWNYGASGYYFATICFKCGCISDICHGKSHLNPFVEIVAEEWIKTAQIRPYVMLDEWVVMPDHFHGLIGIEVNGVAVASNRSRPSVETSHPNVETSRRDVSTRATLQLEAHSLGRLLGNLNPYAPNAFGERGLPISPGTPVFAIISSAIKPNCSAFAHYIRANSARWNPESDKSRLRINQP